MIKLTNGNIIEADAEALINTVNCVGVMGKGIALQFKKAFPEDYFNDYRKSCRTGKLTPGKVTVWRTGKFVNPKFIINFPTKQHWKEKSKYEFIEKGLISLKDEIKKLNIRSVAIPPLGSGLGGLNWEKVKDIIIRTLSDIEQIDILIYEPKGSPEPAEMPVRKVKPKITLARALFIKLMQFYSRHAYRLTLLEIQKLAYLLQESGVPLRLNYVKHIYGPYAHNLNKVLEVMEGHFIRGYGDTQQPDVEIDLLPDAVQQADDFLKNYSAEQEKLEKVQNLVAGFETPYGMELISSVHWVLTRENSEDSVNSIKEWNSRKANLFEEKHIKIAETKLKAEGWIN